MGLFLVGSDLPILEADLKVVTVISHMKRFIKSSSAFFASLLSLLEASFTPWSIRLGERRFFSLSSASSSFLVSIMIERKSVFVFGLNTVSPLPDGCVYCTV